MLQRINLLLGKLICFIQKKHRLPYWTTKTRTWEYKYCNRCGKIMEKKKIADWQEIVEKIWQEGNQIW